MSTDNAPEVGTISPKVEVEDQVLQLRVEPEKGLEGKENDKTTHDVKETRFVGGVIGARAGIDVGSNRKLPVVCAHLNPIFFPPRSGPLLLLIAAPD